MYKAIQSFVGKISMNAGDTIEHIEEEVAKDLIQAGYIVEEKASGTKVAPKEEKEEVVETKVPATKKSKNKK